jgi:hypothetical protein
MISRPAIIGRSIKAHAGTASIGASKYLVANSAADGAGIIYNKAFSKKDGANSVVYGELSVTLNELTAGKMIGLTCGLADAATDAKSGYFIGIGNNAAGNTLLYAVDHGTVKDSVDFGASFVGATGNIALSTSVDSAGVITVKGQILGIDKSVSMTATSADGKVAIATLGTEGTAVAKILKLTLKSFVGAEEQGRSLTNDFASESFNHCWYVSSHDNTGAAADGHVYSKDGVLRFDLAGDGSFFGPKYKYANFDLQFDAKMQQLDEDASGNVIKASTWIGISMGRPSLDAGFAATPLFYMQGETCDDLNMSNGERVWMTDRL